MFFDLSKILGFFALPSNILVTLAVTGAVLLTTRFARSGRRVLIVSVMLIVVLGFSPVGTGLLLMLEDRFPPWDASRGPPDGIVVLSGAINASLSAARERPVLNQSAERMTATADLASRYPAARIVFTGGSGRLFFPGANEAEFARRALERLGVAPERILIERRARNTAENAAFSKELVQPKPGERWLLVTSAFHMPRAVGAFRRAGFPVEAYPVDRRTRGREDLVSPFASIVGGLYHTDLAMHEWVGLAAYWLTGRTSELFPAPRAPD